MSQSVELLPQPPQRLSLRGDRPPGALWRGLRESMRHPDFWALSSWLDPFVRARRSRLGVLWLLAPSVVYIFGLGSFFISMRGTSGASVGEYYAHVALGAMIGQRDLERGVDRLRAGIGEEDTVQPGGRNRRQLRGEIERQGVPDLE